MTAIVPILRSALALGHNPVNGRLHMGTVIADEDHQRAFWPANFCKRIDFAVGTLEGKIPCLPAGRVGAVRYHQVCSAIGPAVIIVGGATYWKMRL